MKLPIRLLIVVLLTMFAMSQLTACGVTVRQGNEVYFSTLAKERAKQQKNIEKRIKEKNAALKQYKQSLVKIQESRNKNIPKLLGENRALHEEIAQLEAEFRAQRRAPRH